MAALMSTGRASRVTAVLLASLTAVFGVAFATPAIGQTVRFQVAAQPATPQPTEAGVAWLAGRFTGQPPDHLETVFDGTAFPDHGLTADAVLAFGAAGVAQDLAGRASDWLARPDNIAAYTGDGTADSYVGPLAKLALVAMVQGGNPAAFGPGQADLIGRLVARQQPASGRFSDLSSFPPPSDFSNGITQSLAVISLLRTGSAAVSPAAAAGADYLVASQCDDGGFPLQFEQPACTSQVDATGFAIQALLAVGRTEVAAPGLDYLQQVQQSGGGFGDSSLGDAPNANSTGLAAQALRVGGRGSAADSALAYLHGLQVGCTGPAEQRGSIRYDQAGSGDTQRATAQGLLGLAGVGLSQISGADGEAATPVLDCTPPSTTTTTTTTSAQAGPVPGGGQLPATGVRPLPAAAFGALLVLSGVLLIVLVRRRVRQ